MAKFTFDSNIVGAYCNDMLLKGIYYNNTLIWSAAIVDPDPEEPEAGVYTITFDAQGGTPAIQTQQTRDYKLSLIPTVTYEGHIFNGWYNGTVDSGAITTSTIFSEDTTVYANWLELITPSDELMYNYYSDTGYGYCSISGYNEDVLSEGAYILPEVDPYEGIIILKIEENAFVNAPLNYIDMSNTYIKEISANAFSNSQLRSIVLPSGANIINSGFSYSGVKIGSNAFFGCLNSLSIPSCGPLEEEAFANSRPKTIYIAPYAKSFTESLCMIPPRLCAGCDLLESFECKVPNVVGTGNYDILIGSYIFDGCSLLSSIRLTNITVNELKGRVDSNWNYGCPIDYIICDDGEYRYEEGETIIVD